MSIYKAGTKTIFCYTDICNGVVLVYIENNSNKHWKIGIILSFSGYTECHTEFIRF